MKPGYPFISFGIPLVIIDAVVLAAGLSRHPYVQWIAFSVGAISVGWGLYLNGGGRSNRN